MRLLLDESVPARLRRYLPSHLVKTVEAFLTVDKNLPYQQNLANLPVAVIVLEAYSNELAALLPLVRNLEQALGSLQPCTFVRVGT